jgi:hypothetical protein
VSSNDALANRLPSGLNATVTAADVAAEDGLVFLEESAGRRFGQGDAT